MLPTTTRPHLLGSRPDLDDWLAAAAARWHAADDAGAAVRAVVTDLAALLPADAGVSVVLRGAGHRPRDPVASCDRAATVDAAQVAGGSGPLLEALGGTPAGSADLAGDPRWPQLACAAAATGLRSATCLPLDTGREVIGALSVYAAGEVPERTALGPVAAHAALALRSVQRIEHLAVALASRDVIGQAKGVLMERYRITADAAFGILVRASQDTHRKVRDVAALVTETGEAPAGPRPADDGR
ncbi:ANTAR domain-containing protein [Geodermatophilus tzadiensis]|uniref:ANTAR domain-containing protein n=1 Tax=Geodermatophilus tzadiensis TaxID=1137988 RepID=A0A2T0TWH0_9ACTN|nr:GAF and ANTAR domain-containing protein [Geodermatophilus tzadiensis]PRY50005.1 ANTAR domain-containing protein [Geodermatophilus tzadiensis]